MKKIFFLALFLVSFSLFAQKQLLFKGKIKIEGNILRGSFDFFLIQSNDSIQEIVVRVGMGPFHRESRSTLEELVGGEKEFFSLNEETSPLMETTPLFFSKDGGILLLKIVTMNGIEEKRILIKHDRERFVAIELGCRNFQKIEKVDLIFVGSVFHLSELQLKKILISYTPE